MRRIETVVVAGLMLAFPAAAQQAPTLKSDVPGIAITALDDLPRGPERDQEASCPAVADRPESAAADHVRERGWSVTGEGGLGDFLAVSFTGRRLQGTSGSCRRLDGNVGLFDGDRLVAVVYGTEAETPKIGRVERFGDDSLRIWDGDYLPQPVADLVVDADGGVTVAALAAEESFCDGDAVVPLIYGIGIMAARELLAEHGWQPVDHSAVQPHRDPVRVALIKLGLIEVENCSGTGFGYCWLDYTGQNAKLWVTTWGGSDGEDGPAVAHYSVTCGTG